MSGARIAGVGAYRPRTVVANDAFEGPRYRIRSGSKERRHAAADETSVMMGAAAVTDALAHAGVAADEIDLLLCFSGMPDFEYPKDANLIKARAGLGKAACWTLDTACASFISGLRCADAMIRAGQHQTVAVVMIMSWVHRGMAEDFDISSLGDGAAAAVVTAESASSLRGVVEVTDPEGFDFVQLGSPFAHDAPQVFTFSHDPRYRAYFGDVALRPVDRLLRAQGVAARDVDWLIAHQVSAGLLGVWCERLGIERERCLDTFGSMGNMSAVNIPMTLDQYVNREPRISRGDTILMYAPGAGMHIGAMLWEY